MKMSLYALDVLLHPPCELLLLTYQCLLDLNKLKIHVLLRLLHSLPLAHQLLPCSPELSIHFLLQGAFWL